MRLDHVVTSGIFSLDGQDFDVDNNVWVYGDTDEVLVIDAPHDADVIAQAVGERRVAMIVCTHGHNDHVNVAATLADRFEAPVALHPDDRMLWDAEHPGREPDVALEDGQVLEAGDVALRVLHTPGHAPGAVCLYDEANGVLFSGDTLFEGGPGATGAPTRTSTRSSNRSVSGC